MAATILEARGLTLLRGSGAAARAVVADVDLDVRSGELLALVGPSGSGKSTLLHLLGGLDRPSSGSVRLLGTPLEQLSEGRLAEVRRQMLGFVFQSFQLVPELSALENALLPARLAGDLTAGRRRVARLFDELGIAPRAAQLPSQLSGGEQQRVAIARALAMEPRLILADEPTGNLDVAAGDQVMEILRAIVSPDRGVVVVTHEARHAELADRVVHLRDGRLA